MAGRPAVPQAPRWRPHLGWSDSWTVVAPPQGTEDLLSQFERTAVSDLSLLWRGVATLRRHVGREHADDYRVLNLSRIRKSDALSPQRLCSGAASTHKERPQYSMLLRLRS
jgi:hypothetical protein